MFDWFKRLKQGYFYNRLQDEDVYTVSDSTMDSVKEGKPISAELALKVMQGDPKAIAELRENKPDKRLPKSARFTKSNGSKVK